MSRNARRPIIVVAEDDEAILELVTVRLELAGYHTIGARDGEHALERVHSTDPAGLVLDIGLPRIDGFGVLSLLRGRDGRACVPTLMLTARHAADDVNRAIELGAWDFLAKPFDTAKLIERVGRMLMRERQPERVCLV